MEKKNRCFKIPRSKYTLKADVYLAIGFIFMFFGAFLLVNSLTGAETFFTTRPVVSLTMSIVFLFCAIVFTESGAFLFVGLSTLVFGVLSLLMDYSIINLTFKELWPIQVIGCGIALIPSGLYTQKRIRSIYLFPALALIVLGIMFLLFSVHVIKVPFTVFIATWWPVAIIAIGAVLVSLFWVQKSQHSRIIPYMEDDSLVDGE